MDDFLKEVILICAKMFDGIFNTIGNILIKTPFEYTNGSTLSDIQKLVKPIAFSLIAFLFLIEFLKITVRSEILKHEWAFMIFFKFVLAKVAVDYCDELLEVIFEIGTNFLQGMQWSSNTMTNHVNANIIPKIQDLGFLESISFVALSIIPLCVSFLSVLLVIAIAYGRLFEMIVHIIIAPIPAACLLLDNSRITKKFFFSFGAVTLQGVFILIAFKVFQALFQMGVGNTFNLGSDIASMGQIITGIWIMALLSIVLVMAIFQSGAWANKILDAN